MWSKFGILRPSAVASPRWSIDSPERLNGVIKTVESTSVVFALEAYDASRRHLQVNIAFNASPHPLFFSCVLGNSHTSFFLNCSLLSLATALSIPVICSAGSEQIAFLQRTRAIVKSPTLMVCVMEADAVTVAVDTLLPFVSLNV